MAATLLEDLRAHIAATATAALPGLVYRYSLFTDADLQGAAPVLLLRRSGTGGEDDDITQQTDVDLVLVVSQNQVKAGEDAALAIRQFLKTDAGFTGAGAFGYILFGPIIGPTQLQNGRLRFMFMVRCFTEDQ